MKDQIAKFSFKINGGIRWLMWNYLTDPLNLVLVSEFPKSGGTWFSQMLADALNIPFPRNRIPNDTPCLLHGHHLYKKNFGKMIGVVRDGRDIMVSAYHHFLLKNDKNTDYAINFYRQRVPFDDYDNIEANMSAFIIYMFEGYAKRPRYFDWSEFTSQCIDDPNICLIKYEDLLKQASEKLNEAISFLGYPSVKEKQLDKIVEAYSFKNLTKRKPGEESKQSFLRKGVAGDWKNYFNHESRQVFDQYGGETLIKLGYEKDNKWVFA
ncbi:MAG: sulfotransferase domain-containing protein [Bacteroidota bacterium]